MMLSLHPEIPGQINKRYTKMSQPPEPFIWKLLASIIR